VSDQRDTAPLNIMYAIEDIHTGVYRRKNFSTQALSGLLEKNVDDACDGTSRLVFVDFFNPVSRACALLILCAAILLCCSLFRSGAKFEVQIQAHSTILEWERCTATYTQDLSIANSDL
jgi:hypothetical protein